MHYSASGEEQKRNESTLIGTNHVGKELIAKRAHHNYIATKAKENRVC